MTSTIFADVSRNYYAYKIIQPMTNILAKFRANILSCYLIIAHLSDLPQAKIHEKWQKLGKIKMIAKNSFPPFGDW